MFGTLLSKTHFLQIVLGLMYLNYELALRGFSTIYLGQSLPLNNLDYFIKSKNNFCFITVMTVMPYDEKVVEYFNEIDNSLKDANHQFLAIGRKIKLVNNLSFKANIKLAVVKNTLLAKAMNKSDKDFGELPTVLKGNTSILLSDTGNAPAKLIKEFRKKSDKPLFKGAYVTEAIYIGDDQLDTLVNIKSKEELIGDIITILQSPAKNVISALQSGGNKLSGILQTLSEKE